MDKDTHARAYTHVRTAMTSKTEYDGDSDTDSHAAEEEDAQDPALKLFDESDIRPPPGSDSKQKKDAPPKKTTRPPPTTVEMTTTTKGDEGQKEDSSHGLIRGEEVAPSNRCMCGCTFPVLCSERRERSQKYQKTGCYRFCCFPCRLMCSQKEITNCQRAYIIFIHCMVVALIASNIGFAWHYLHLPWRRDEPNVKVHVDYVMRVERTNTTTNDTLRVFIADLTPYAQQLPTTDNDLATGPLCDISPSGPRIVMRVTVTSPASSSNCHVYIQSDNTLGAQPDGLPNTFVWVSNSTESDSETLPDGLRIHPSTIVQLV